MFVYMYKLNQVHGTTRCKIIQTKIVCWGPDSKFTQSTGCSFSNNYFQVTQIIDLVTSQSGVKGRPSKNVLQHILFLFISASEQPILTIIVPIPHNYGYVRGLAYDFGRLHAQKLSYYTNQISKRHIFARKPFKSTSYCL